MYENHDSDTPGNLFPRDVTSPGPDQRPGVARSRRTKAPFDDLRQLPQPQKNDKPGDTGKPPKADVDS